jgi:hypothetical protein
MHYYSKTFVLLLCVATSVLAIKADSQNGIISEDLRHELKTQEVILERIIKHYDKNRIIVHHNVTSYYIEDYGTLFEVQRFPTSELNLFNQFGASDNKSKTKYVWSEEKNTIVKFESKHSKEDSIQVVKMVDDFIKDLHLAVFEFFADYISAVNWLKENDKVCIHFDINLYRKIPNEYNRAMVENIIPVSIQASVETSTLKEFQKGNLSIEQFDRKIKIDKILINPQSYNYKILGDVIVSGVKSIKEENKRPFSGYTTSFNIPDLGAMYFLVAQYHSTSSFDDIGGIFEYLFGKRFDKDYNNEDEDPFSDSLIELKYKLAKSVGQYGHKLDNLEGNQWIVLFVNIGRNHGGFKSRFVMKIQKKYVDIFAGDNISFEEFADHVQIYDEEFYQN